MKFPMMKCGHTAQGVDTHGNPVCISCLGDKRATEVDITPDLTGREAICTCCGWRQPANVNLPFFEYCKDTPTDRFYCGCKGWN